MNALTQAPCDYPDATHPVYLTGVSNEHTRAAGRHDLGLLVVPGNGTHRQIEHYGLFGADNGCFAESLHGKPFDEHRWLDWLAALPAERCLFATLPDVVTITEDGPVGDPVGTFRRSLHYFDRVADMRLPIGWVAQDNIEQYPHLLEQMFDMSDCIFIGGSDAWKLGAGAAEVVAEAKRRGKWTHVGRVNSRKRLQHCARIGADSADGTYLRFGKKIDRERNFRRLIGWLDELTCDGSCDVAALCTGDVR